MMRCSRRARRSRRRPFRNGDRTWTLVPIKFRDNGGEARPESAHILQIRARSASAPALLTPIASLRGMAWVSAADCSRVTTWLSILKSSDGCWSPTVRHG